MDYHRIRTQVEIAEAAEVPELKSTEGIGSTGGTGELSVSELLKMVDKLAPKMREVFYGKCVDGLSTQELAEKLQTSPGTVGTQLFYARKLLNRKARMLQEHRAGPKGVENETRRDNPRRERADETQGSHDFVRFSAFLPERLQSGESFIPCRDDYGDDESFEEALGHHLGHTGRIISSIIAEREAIVPRLDTMSMQRTNPLEG